RRIAQDQRMAIPDFQSLMLPLLRSLADGPERSTQETLDALAEELGLTEADVTQPLPSRKAPLFTNRVAWAKLHLKRAGLIDSPRRGVYRLTERGRVRLVRHRLASSDSDGEAPECSLGSSVWKLIGKRWQ